MTLNTSGKKLLILLIGLVVLLSIGNITYRLLTQEQVFIGEAFRTEEESTIQSLPSAILTIKNCTATPDTQEAQAFLAELNAYRAQKGQSQLKTSPTLMRAAAWWAQNMVDHNLTGHIDSLGRDPGVRAKDCGYTTGSIVENTAGGDSINPLPFWQQSTGHDANLLKSNSQVMGYAHAGSGNKNRYVYIAGSVDDSDTQDPIPTATPTPTSTQAPTNTPTPSPTNTPTPTSSNTTPTLHPTPTAVATPTPLAPTPTFSPNTPKVGFNVVLPGTGQGGNQSPISTDVAFELEIFDTQNRKALSKTIFLKYNGGAFEGTVELGGVAPGEYYFKIKRVNSLVRETGLFAIQNSQTTQIPTLELITGDFTNDNVLDIRDYNLFISQAGTCFAQSCTGTSQFDLDFDGQITGVDYNILLRMFSVISGR